MQCSQNNFKIVQIAQKPCMTKIRLFRRIITETSQAWQKKEPNMSPKRHYQFKKIDQN